MTTKKTKALVAAGAGAAVLLASGATFALWQDTDSIAGAEVNTGSLSIDAGELEWTDRSTDGNNNVGDSIDINTFRLVPGDVIRGTDDIGLVTEFLGDNMAVRLDVVADNGQIIWTGFANANGELGFNLANAAGAVAGFDFVSTDARFPGLQVDADITIRPGSVEDNTPSTVPTLGVTVDWTRYPLMANTTYGADSSFNISGAEFVLSQVRPGDIPNG
jgi:alternate signal-mediated exported protein